MRPRLTALLAAGPLVLAACGSTVAPTGLAGQAAGTVAAGSELGASIGVDAEGSASGADAAAPGIGRISEVAPGSSATGGAAGRAAGAAGDASTAVDPATGGAPGAPTAGAAGTSRARGVTSTSIRLGVPVEQGTQAAADAFGIQGASTLSTERIVDALVADVNRTGGVLGRKLEAVYHYFDAAEAISNPDRTVAKICEDFGKDRPVFAVAIGLPLVGLRKCTAEMGSPLWLVSGFGSTIPAAAYTENGGSYLYGVASLTMDRLAELFIASLEDRRFHETWNTTSGGPGVQPTRLGVIHVDTPDQNHLYASYATQLAKHKRRFEATVTYPQNAQDALAATQSAVLKFKAEGVTHVYGASVFFLQAAEQQQYRPRYAYLPGLGALGVANSPKAQLRGAMTVGWLPTRDVNAPQDPGATPGADRCLKVMRSAGLDTANRSNVGPMTSLCDAVYSLRDALVAGRSISVAGLRQGFESLATGFPPASTFRTSVGPGRHAGVQSVRDMAFDSGCGCLVYTSRADRS